MSITRSKEVTASVTREKLLPLCPTAKSLSVYYLTGRVIWEYATLVEKLTQLLECPATRMSKIEVACPMSVLDHNLNHMFITAKLHALYC